MALMASGGPPMSGHENVPLLGQLGDEPQRLSTRRQLGRREPDTPTVYDHRR
jgi:hypothetical protein